MEVRDKGHSQQSNKLNTSLLMQGQGSLNCISVLPNTSVPLSYDQTISAIITGTISSEIINWWLLRPSL